MTTDNWVVNNRAGEEWGLIKRLILDSATRQIHFADVVVIRTGHVTRIPWDNLEIGQGGFTIGVPDVQGASHGMRPCEMPPNESISINLWP